MLGSRSRGADVTSEGSPMTDIAAVTIVLVFFLLTAGLTRLARRF